MGYYINPKGQSKESWLRENGKLITRAQAQEWNSDYTEEFVLVCLVENFSFTAAGICVDNYEKDAFLNDRSGRPMEWWKVPADRFDRQSWSLAA